MGIVPDLAAVRAVKRNAKLHAVSKRREYAASVTVKENSSSQREKDEDERALENIRRTEIRNLLETLVKEGVDEPDVILADPNLVKEWRVQHNKSSVQEGAGVALGDALNSLRSGSEKKSFASPRAEDLTYPDVADSDGDIDVSTVRALANCGNKDEGNLKQEVVYRDEDGRRITRARWLEIQANKKGGYKVKKNSASEPLLRSKQPAVTWGVGLHQQRELERRVKEEEDISSQPLARYSVDVTYDEELKEKVHWNDPLRHVGGVKVAKDAAGSERKFPPCRFPAPPNRFNIKPGYRWDGVIRGNGYEQRLLKEKNKRAFQETEAFKWSIEDA